MTKNEKVNIGANLAILMQAILGEWTSSEDVANHAINLARDMLGTYPDIKKIVEEMLQDGGHEVYLAWIKWEREILNK